MKVVPEAKFLNLEYIFKHLFILIRVLLEKFVALAEWLSRFAWLSIILSIIFLAGIIFLIYKISRLRKKKMANLVEFFVLREEPPARMGKWETIKEKIDSENPSDWKMAIIEADSLLDQIITAIGYSGENLGERLKNIEPSDFENLQGVWEAHKTRNKIAHEGDTFTLTKEEAKETLEKYKKALKEFRYI